MNKLKNTLNAYKNQTILPYILIVVNNNSTDGTKNYLDQWKFKNDNFNKIVLNLPSNIGGSGGFYEGSKKALDEGADWVWFSDDDAYPADKAIENLIRHIKYTNNKIAAICSAVIENQRISTIHRKKLSVKNNEVLQESIPREEYHKKCFSLQLFSYVGTTIRGSALKEFFLFIRMIRSIVTEYPSADKYYVFLTLG